MSRAPEYDIAEELGEDEHSYTPSPGWVICVVRLGLPLSFSRKDKLTIAKARNDVSEGARLRGANLIIASDCISLAVTANKDSHLKSMMAELRQTDHNYLVEILPGDWVLAWMVDHTDKLASLIKKIKNEEACNAFDDGLKFVGRVETIRKRQRLNRESGIRTSSITLGASAFKELDSQFFYDPLLSQADETLGTWLTRLGADVSAIFDVDVKDGQTNNAGKLIKLLIQLIVGKGIESGKVNAAAKYHSESGGNPSALQASAGGGTLAGGEQAPYAYCIPRVVGKLLGVSDSQNPEVSRPGGILGYADILATLIGVQTYDNKDADEVGTRFHPTLSELLGTYLPVMPNFTNQPLWSLLQQFLNPHINEMYTALRVNKEGRVMPTLVARQIPSTDALPAQKETLPSGGVEYIKVTRFLDLPRWVLPPVLANDVDLGRSDATRFNFVHIYGQDSNQAEGVTFSQQLVANPPARDDLDIQRSGLRPYMATVACALRGTVGDTPNTWIALVADRVVGSQYTLNGTIQSFGISAPIAEGDNLVWDGVVYQIESVFHHCVVSSDGKRSFSTTVTLTNGLRDKSNDDLGGDDTGGGDQPIYPGFVASDGTTYDPGLSLDDVHPRTAPSTDQGDLSGQEQNTPEFKAKQRQDAEARTRAAASVPGHVNGRGVKE